MYHCVFLMLKLSSSDVTNSCMVPKCVLKFGGSTIHIIPASPFRLQKLPPLWGKHSTWPTSSPRRPSRHRKSKVKVQTQIQTRKEPYMENNTHTQFTRLSVVFLQCYLNNFKRKVLLGRMLLI